MKQEQVRPIRREKAGCRQDGGDSVEDLCPLSAREFLKAPTVTAARKSFRYRLDDQKDIPQSRE